jgi:hypothetical protein
MRRSDGSMERARRRLDERQERLEEQLTIFDRVLLRLRHHRLWLRAQLRRTGNGRQV